MAKQYDRSAEDLGNIVGLEHVNLLVPDQGLATLFYISGLGLTRDPYLMTSVDNMWVNVGRSQFHLPTGKAQKLRGRTALVIPGRDLLLKRLENMKKPLDGTQFSFKEHKEYVTAICPWGNEYVVYEPSKSFAGMVLGMPYVEFDVPKKTAKGIADFYSKVLGTMTSVKGLPSSRPVSVTRVCVSIAISSSGSSGSQCAIGVMWFAPATSIPPSWCRRAVTPI